MHEDSIDYDAAMLFYNCYSKWDGNDFTELYESMGAEEIDALYTVADEVFDYSPSFKTENEKYSLENVKYLACVFIADCIHYVIDTNYQR